MSSIRAHINAHNQQQSDRRRVRMQVESMWADAAARKYLDIIDQLEQADRNYIRALSELDTAFDLANRMLGF